MSRVGVKTRRLTPYYMAPVAPAKTYWDVYRVAPNHVKQSEFLTHRYEPSCAGFSSPHMTFLGGFPAYDENEAIALARAGSSSDRGSA